MLVCITTNTVCSLAGCPSASTCTWKGLVSLESSTYAVRSCNIRAAPHVTKQPRRQGKLVARKSFLHCMRCWQSQCLGEWRNILASFPMCKKVLCLWRHLFWSVNLMKNCTVTCMLQSDWTTQFHATTQVNDSRRFHIDVKGQGSRLHCMLNDTCISSQM